MVNKPNILLVDSINEESRQIVKILSDKYSVHIEEEYGEQQIIWSGNVPVWFC